MFVHSQRGRWVGAYVYMYTVQCAVYNVHVHITHFIYLFNCVLKGTVIPTGARLDISSVGEDHKYEKRLNAPYGSQAYQNKF